MRLAPTPLGAPLGRLYERYLYPPGTPRPDFLSPAGEAALTPAGSVSWRVFANPVVLFVGGVLAVILELALPPVRHGVWDHSTFRTDPRLRLQRTGLAAMVTIYAGASVARAMIEGVNRRHAAISGVTDAGEPYRADEARLLVWVHATAAFGFGEAYARLVAPLTAAQWDAYFSESRPVALAYGARGAPGSVAAWSRLLSATAPSLEGSEALDAFLRIMARDPVLPPVARPLQAPLVRVAASLVPEEAGLTMPAPWRRRPGDLALARAAALAAEHVTLPVAPPVLACRRLGLDPGSVLSGPLPAAARRTGQG